MIKNTRLIIIVSAITAAQMCMPAYGMFTRVTSFFRSALPVFTKNDVKINLIKECWNFPPMASFVFLAFEKDVQVCDRMKEIDEPKNSPKIGSIKIKICIYNKPKDSLEIGPIRIERTKENSHIIDRINQMITKKESYTIDWIKKMTIRSSQISYETDAVLEKMTK